MARIDNEIIRKARQTDLPSFLLSRGEPLKKAGKRFRHKVHDSLLISRNMFYWNSRQEKGNSLDFVMLFYEWDFERAVKELTGFDSSLANKVKYEEEPKELHITKGNNVKRAIAYLCKSRYINYSIVRKLIESKHISQDERGNVVFKVYDESRNLVGAEIVGTLSNVRYKELADGSKLGYGFNFTVGQPLKTLFFESPIEALSFWTLFDKKVTNHRLVSLAGLRQDIFVNALDCFKIATQEVYLCVNRDKAGESFIKAVQAEYKDVNVYLPSEPYNDWNDMLRATC